MATNAPWNAQPDVRGSLQQRGAETEIAGGQARIAEAGAQTAEAHARTADIQFRSQQAKEQLERERKKAQQAGYSLYLDANKSLQALNKIRILAGSGAAGYNQLLRDLPESDARALNDAIKEYQASAFQQFLARRTQETPKGGSAFGGRILATEVPLIMDSNGRIDPALDVRTLINTVDTAENNSRRQVAISLGQGPKVLSPDPKVRLAAETDWGILPPGTTRYPIAPNEPPIVAPPELKIAGPGGTKAHTVPRAMQDEFTAGVIPMLGDATADPSKYAALRETLQQKYGFGPASPADEEKYRLEFKQLQQEYAQGRAPNLAIPPVAEPMSWYEKARADLHARPGVAKTEAFLAGAVKPVSPFFTRDALSQQALLQSEHPGYAMAGNIAGNVALGTAMTAAGAPPVAADLVLGAGSAYDPDRPFTSMAMGAGESALLGGATRGVMRGVMGGAETAAPTLTGKYGVPVTMGNIGNKYLMPAYESAVSKLPVVGQVVEQARERMLRGVNSAAMQHAADRLGTVTDEAGIVMPALQHSGATGEAGVTELADAIPDAFKAAEHEIGAVPNPRLPAPEPEPTVGKKPLRGKAEKEPPRMLEQAAIDAAAKISETLPDAGQRFLKRVLPLVSKDEITGPDVQAILSRNRVENSLVRDQNADEWAAYFKPHIDEFQRTLIDQIPDTGSAALRQAKDFTRHTSILEDAVWKSEHPEQLFTAPELVDATKLNAETYGGKLAYMRDPNAPFKQFNQEAMRLMPPQTAAAQLTAAGVGAGLGTGEAAVEAALTPRDKESGDFASQFGTKLARNIGLGAAALVPALGYTKAGQTLVNQLYLRKLEEDAAKRSVGALLQRYLPGAVGTGVATYGVHKPLKAREPATQLNLTPWEMAPQLPWPDADVSMTPDLEAYLDPNSAAPAPSPSPTE